MKSLDLGFEDRVKLTNFLALASGPLGKMDSLQRILDQVRLTDAELQQCRLKDEGNGTHSIVPPGPPFGSIEAKVEDADALVLLREVEAHQSFQIADLAWVRAVKTQLTAASIQKRRK